MPSTPAAIQCFERTSQAKRPAGSNKTKKQTQTNIFVVVKKMFVFFFLLCVVVATYKQLKYIQCVSPIAFLLSDPSFSLNIIYTFNVVVVLFVSWPLWRTCTAALEA